VSPSLVMANHCFSCDTARSDSDLEFNAIRRSSTLVAEMMIEEGDCHI